MKILVYHGKFGDDYWLADTPEQQEAAFKKLFQGLDSFGFYNYDSDYETVAAARQGDRKAIRRILESRCHYEYEKWDLVEVTDPCE